MARHGSAPVTVLGAVLCAALIVPPAYTESLGGLVAACVGLGYANGTLDVAMNVNGVTVERRVGRPILGRLHALFSLGVLAASALAVVMTTLSALVAVAGTALVVTLLAAPRLARGDAAAAGTPPFARPSRALAALGAVAFAALLCEGAVADWSAVHLRETLDAPRSVAPLALAAFSVTMIIGRLASDRVLPSVRLSGALAALGLLLGALAPDPALSIAGFLIAGLGLSSLFPTAIRRADSGPAIAAVSSLGYAGLVTGPPLIGAVAEATSLRTALAVILTALAAGIVVVGR